MLGLGKIHSDRFEPMNVETPAGVIHLRVSRGDFPASRTPLVCVHGLVIPGSYMIPLAHLLAPEKKVIVPDLPGYGESHQPEDIPGPAELADSLVAMLDALELRRADFLGNSYGCQVLAKLGERHPKRVRRIVLIGPTVDPSRRGFWRQFGLLLATGLFEDASLALLLIAEFLKAGPSVVFQTVRNCLDDAIEESLPHVRAPVLIVRGSRDFMVNGKWAEKAARLLPDAELRTVKRAAHGLNYSSPHKLARVIQPFLGE